MENIFKWNVADIFSNFFFISNYVNLGGETGDDPAQVSLDAQEVKDWGARVLGHCNDHAVAQAIEVLDGIY